MRKEINDRYYRVFTYQTTDRVPDIEFGYWPQTIRRWLREGMPLELTPEEQNQMFSAKVDRFMGFDTHHHASFPLHVGMNPCFEEKVLEKREGSTVVRQESGVISERFLNDQDESSIPHFIEFPVKTPDDWAAMKERYRIDDPVRAVKAESIDRARVAVGEGRMISMERCWAAAEPSGGMSRMQVAPRRSSRPGRR